MHACRPADELDLALIESQRSQRPRKLYGGWGVKVASVLGADGSG
jgi:hypothetical protein